MADAETAHAQSDNADADTGAAAEPLALMLSSLREATRTDFSAHETAYHTFMSGAELEVQRSDFYGLLLELHSELSEQRVVGKIRAIESWSDGETEFRVVTKPWHSVVDKLYRINIEENPLYSLPPLVHTLDERAAGRDPSRQHWITPSEGHTVIDDLLRTKFVVPFVDGVITVSDRIAEAMDTCGLRRFRRYHAKDSGYHARHYYALLPVPGHKADTSISLEIKVLTKMQDTLGELTHLLYEGHRTGRIPLEKKRKVAWMLHEPDFLATYLGHSGHFLEASVAKLKEHILELEANA